MKIKIVFDAGAQTVDYEVTVPNQAIADELLKSIYEKASATAVKIGDSTGAKCVFHTSRFVCAMVVE